MAQHPDYFAFENRHIGPDDDQRKQMLSVVGAADLDDLLARAVPADIRLSGALELPEAVTETEAIARLRAYADANTVVRSMIGLGYYDTHLPAVIKRNVLESPAWYTAYTPYQPEISQGRLEALLNFQTVVSDLTGLAIAGASLLDEATAAAEAMTLALRSWKGKSERPTFVVDVDTFPQTRAVIRTRAEALGLRVLELDLTEGLEQALFHAEADLADVFGVLVQYPAGSGQIRDPRSIIQAAQGAGALAVVATDLLALSLLTSPGELGADIAVGSAQRFGVPMGYGGPHAGFMAVREGLQRTMPGRLVGVSVDAGGGAAYRLALQTREQHIRREKATSNICTAQVLLAIIASMYAVYHGPDGLRAIARKVHSSAVRLAASLSAGGVEVVSDSYFDTLTVRVPGGAADVVARALDAGINLWLVDDDTLQLSVDETTTEVDLDAVAGAFGVDLTDPVASDALSMPRESQFLMHPVFHTHHSETSMLRYLRSLSDKDYALDRGMIPLGSCTMKLNATTEMEPITWPEFGRMHPFAPVSQAQGYAELFADLERWLASVTGYDAVSLQPNAGSQGEFAGLLAIAKYHEDNGQAERNICLIPSSAHGTNAASAVMAGLKVVVVKCDHNGNIDIDDLRAKIEQHASHLAAMMVTYPSTHGVYEQTIREVCGLVHDAGGQVYVDGANLNALVGLAQPGKFGSDVSHLNLHKTFCIPHGGGGPGVGPIGVREHLAPYLPNHPLVDSAGPATGPGPVSAAPWGSAGILPISWAYIAMMGGDGLSRATANAVLNANYVAARLRDHYPVLYAGTDGFVAHECILDIRPLTKATGVTVDDVAKRLIDYGFHAPTMSFPVAGTLMVEPTESEDLAELDRFCEAMIAIRAEADRVSAGDWPADDNPLRGAPHTALEIAGQWPHAYTREEAAYPTEDTRRAKYWAPVQRIDGAYGDRNLVCSCPAPEAFED
ncbi:aminomethyl-transferring glycine dehydrogenase [Epidermidibacterium keratini]|uniref:Glycine dehydrogenase (decarboxylating) n=1 Tax=Epidermidibacterium keratini TaxID=1891644 RepID=A0A7L4YSC7_9ACTN|nr:aminomethyl-transferring glycine dehydrogenase [Epidermidibacterium keratini]QHC02161.1 aminomethyl-transferring glycine dehydrogenase [Epidermidibacterium keratini]